MNVETSIGSDQMSQVESVVTTPSGLLQIDAQSFNDNFNRRPFTIRHQLAGHSLFTLPQLVELSRRLPAENVKYQMADLPVQYGLYDGPQSGLSIEETIRQIEECRSWMVLRWVEKDPAYRELLDQLLDEIQQFSEPLAAGMCRREGFIFISSPGAVTPFHLDPEYNFLLQIKGHKTVHMFAGSERPIFSARELEEFMAAEGRSTLVFKDEYEAKATVIDLTPGAGLHFPVYAPHWVQNGDQVSISFSITFRTPASERWSIVNDVNTRLRRFGMNPRPYGDSRLSDSAKYQTYRVIRRARKLITRS